MTGFDRLSGALQYHIVNSLGWKDLRPVQQETIDAVLDGNNCVVLAPTAGGKTEAAFFPLLSLMDTEDWRAVSVVYLSPIRALLNNQEDRITHLAGLLGRRAFKWHGDVASTAKRRFIGDPADILLTTPESLEAMLMSPRVPADELFAGLRAVIIDEVHAFADDDRGAHLSALMERFSRFCGKDLQRVGLSATVGNPDEILRWVKGSSERSGRVVDPRGEKKPPQITLDYVASDENAVQMVKSLHPGRKRLVFVESRRLAEKLGQLLLAQDVLAYVIHGSLSFPERRQAERAFFEGRDCVIVATSALELGIDVGDLDHVLQVDSPRSVASFLQRMGRTGRRADTVTNCTFLATKEPTLLQAAGILQLHREGFVEDVEPCRISSHILAHQLMALSVQHSGVPKSDWWAWIDGATAFADLTEEDRQAVLSHMLEADILSQEAGKLWLGEKGEHRYGRANFMQLYAVFDAPRLVSVRWNKREIGQVDAKFLANIDSDPDSVGMFILAGRAWQIELVEWERGICIVKPAPEGRAARWFSGGQFLSYELCQAMRRVLVSDDVDEWWSQRAQRVLTTMRAEHGFLRDERSPLLDGHDEIIWWSFAGGAANVLLARMLESKLGGKVVVRNLNISLLGDAAKSIVAVREYLHQLADQGRPTREDGQRHAAAAQKGRISKFQPCLPEETLWALIENSVLDLAGAREVVQHIRSCSEGKE